MDSSARSKTPNSAQKHHACAASAATHLAPRHAAAAAQRRQHVAEADEQAEDAAHEDAADLADGEEDILEQLAEPHEGLGKAGKDDAHGAWRCRVVVVRSMRCGAECEAGGEGDEKS